MNTMSLYSLAVPVLALTFAVGCAGQEQETSEEEMELTIFDTAGGIDADGDSVTVGDGDCDDEDPEIYPGRAELCNGVDDNCNSVTDEGTSDVDGDGQCDQLDAETCDGYDNDGDGRVDEDFADEDLDGIADCVDAEDCDGLDNDGDGEIDEGYDADGDGYAQCGELGVADCDDQDSQINPGISEVSLDLTDNNCDGTVDEDDFVEGDLLITEIMTNPAAVSDPAGEWFELYNASTREIAVNGLWISDQGVEGHQIISAELVSVDAGEYLVLAGNGAKGENGGVVADYVYSDVSLSNASDTLAITVVSASGSVTLDGVSWDDGESYPDASGSSMSLDPDYTDGVLNDDGSAWCAASEAWRMTSDFGSPGVENPPCSDFDHDGDGMSADEGDCDDNDPAVYQGAPESNAKVDNDCDGVVENGPIVLVEVGEGSELEQCGILFLDATGTYDPEGDQTLSWAWELVSAPAASMLTTADITPTGTGAAWFEPDADGAYQFDVVAFDSGGASSEPVTLEVIVADRIGNNAPIADAGENISETSTVECNGEEMGAPFDCAPCDLLSVDLDGSDSDDPDGDTISLQWTLLSGNATLSNSTDVSPTLLVSGPMPESAGSTENEVVYLLLEATDCMGSTSVTDVITVDYTCAGVVSP